MKSSREVLKGLDKNLLYLEWHVNDGDTIVVQDCIRHVGYLEEIINELIGETVDLNKTIDKMLERDIEFINGLNKRLG